MGCEKWEPNNAIREHYKYIAAGSPVSLCGINNGLFLSDAETNELLQAWELSYKENPYSIQKTSERAAFDAYRAEIEKRRKL